MVLAGVSHNVNRAEGRGAAHPSADIEHKLDPGNAPSEERPSITSMSQTRSYGQQNFARDEVVSRPRTAPTIALGGGRSLPQPAPAPAPALGYAAAHDRARSGPAHDR